MNSESDSVLKNKAKRLRKLLEALEGQVLLVEGERDRKALQELGLNAKIVVCNQSAEKVAERLTEGKAFVLTDFDRRGEERAKALEDALQAHRIEADLSARRDFRRILGLSFFEEVFTRFTQFKEKCVEKKVVV